jgi:hypothetical protein
MKKIISLLALITMLFSANSIEAKNKKVPESITIKKPTIIKKVYYQNNHTYKNAYKYDENGNMINKITFIKEEGFWKPVSAYSIYYGENENTVTFALWDVKSKTFTLNAKQNKYSNKEFLSVIDTIDTK